MMMCCINASALEVRMGVVRCGKQGHFTFRTTTPYCIGWCGAVCGRGENWVRLTMQRNSEGEMIHG